MPSRCLFNPAQQSPAGTNRYAVHRYYSYRLGRFMTPDPIAGFIPDPQTLNRYPYVINDPINLVDPLGLVVCEHVCWIGSEGGYYCGPSYCYAEFVSGDCFLSFWGPGCVEGLGHHIGPLTIPQPAEKLAAQKPQQRVPQQVGTGLLTCLQQAIELRNRRLREAFGTVEITTAKLWGRTAIGAGFGALVGLRVAVHTGVPWALPLGAVFGAGLGVATQAALDAYTIRSIQQQFVGDIQGCLFR